MRDSRSGAWAGERRREDSGGLSGANRGLLVYVTVSGVLGGVDTYLLNNARLMRAHYRVWVVVGHMSAVAYYADRSEIDRVVYFPLTRAASLLYLIPLMRLLRRQREVIIHTNDLVGCLWGKLFSLLHGASAEHITTIHSVVTEHRVMGPAKQQLVFGMSRLLRKVRQAGFICVSRQVRQSLADIGVIHRVMLVLYSGLGTGDVAPSRRCPHDLVTRVGFVGRLSPEKGPDLFLDCIEGLPQCFEIHVYGDGSMRALFETQRAARVRCHGFVDDRSEIYRHLDVVCITSRTESMSFVLPEALSVGCTVFALRLPVFEELLENSPLREAILCTDLAEMRRRIEATAQGDAQIDQRWVRRFLDRFDNRRYGERLLEVYRSISG